MKIARLSFLIFALLLFGCACAQARSESEMQEMASALTKVAKTTETTVRYEKLGLDLRDMDLLILATRHDQELLTPLKGYTLRAKPEAGHAVVLVCTSDGSTALLEDAGCTARLDQHHWRAQPPLPCEFTLDLAKVCPTSPPQ